MTSATEELLAFPDTRARQLAGVSMRRLRYWKETGLVVPSIQRQLSPKNTVRLYSFADLLDHPGSRAHLVLCAVLGCWGEGSGECGFTWGGGP
jgi:hypothetical protein